MAKVTWLGEDTATEPGPSFNMWNGIKFPKGKAVEVTDAHMLGKAKANPRFFKVAEAKIEEPKNAETPKEKVEAKPKEEKSEEKAYDFREAEKISGYSPVKKRVRKPRAKPPEA